MALLKAENISVEFDGKEILDQVSIHLNEGELVSIIGISGSGKTTLFNVLSGLITPKNGTVFLNEEDITGKTGHMSYMLQKDLLLPYKTIMDNVLLPLTIKGIKNKKAKALALPLFETFGLLDTINMYPGELSGGMRQRVALLRTYMCNLPLTLLDEPFSALDAITKNDLHQWYLGICKELKLSTLLITHDIDEAILLSDRIYILGNAPASIKKEIVIAPSDVRRKDLLLSDEFLHYKRTILDSIGEY